MVTNLFGSHLRFLRKQRRLTLAHIATQANIDVSYLSRIESGVRSVPSRRIRNAIAVALDLNTSELETLNHIAETCAPEQSGSDRRGKMLAFLLVDEALARKILKAINGETELSQPFVTEVPM